MTKAPIAVLGTGMAGFGAGHALYGERVPFVCYDRNPWYGGHTHSWRYDGGFTFDEGGHISFTKDSHVQAILAENVNGHYEERKLGIDNYWHGYRIPHPVQCHLRGLPSELVLDVLKDFIGTHEHKLERSSSNNYTQWLYATYGKTFAETFPMVYGEKYHTTTMDRLTTDWIGPRMYGPSLDDVLRGAIEGSFRGTHYVDTYRYPTSGGFDAYLEPFSRRFELRLGYELTALDPGAKLLHFSNGKTEEYGDVISTIPLPDLIPRIHGVPEDVRTAASRLAFTTAVLFNFAINRADISHTAITYFYDTDLSFARVNLPHMFSSKNAPAECGLIQAEIYFSDKYRPAPDRPREMTERVLSDLRRCGFLLEEDSILLQDVVVNKYANIIYDLDREDSLRQVQGYLDDVGIHYCGRYGNWDHAWTDQAFLSGEKAAQRLLDHV